MCQHVLNKVVKGFIQQQLYLALQAGAENNCFYLSDVK